MGRVQGSGQEYCENGKENHVGRSSQLLVEFADIPDREPVLHMVCQFQACSAGVSPSWCDSQVMKRNQRMVKNRWI